MNQTIMTTLIIFFFIIGCKKDNNPVSTVSTEPAFVIDTMKVSAIVKTDTSTVSHGTYFSIRLAFHFLGKSGSLDGTSFSTSDLTTAAIFEPICPTAIGLQSSISPEFHNSSTFSGQDSLFVRIGFGGRFWERNDTTITNYGTFSVRDSMWIQLQR